MISFVVPAHNEEQLIGRTLAELNRCAELLQMPYEVIVVNDASTDRTAQIATEHRAQVIDVHHRQIAATRNSGAKAAQGETIIFIDADTTVTPEALRGAIGALQKGAIGGGCRVRFDGPVPLYGHILVRVILPLALPLLRVVPGCFIFCSRSRFLETGGFDESFYCTEEVDFIKRLRKLGRIAILRDHVFTSGRKVRTHSALGMIRIGLRLLWGGQKSIRRREGLEFWYGPRT